MGKAKIKSEKKKLKKKKIKEKSQQWKLLLSERGAFCSWLIFGEQE